MNEAAALVPVPVPAAERIPQHREAHFLSPVHCQGVPSTAAHPPRPGPRSWGTLCGTYPESPFEEGSALNVDGEGLCLLWGPSPGKGGSLRLVLPQHYSRAIQYSAIR